MTAPARVRHRLSASDVLRMTEVGILTSDRKVELVDGELVEMSPQGPAHAGLTARIHRLLERALGDGFHVRDHSPIDAGPYDLPEPDLAVVPGEPSVERLPVAADLVLVVEISVTSQREDAAKARIYAGAGVPVYWHLDVSARRLDVYEDPRPERQEYARRTRLADSDEVLVRGQPIPLRSLLP